MKKIILETFGDVVEEVHEAHLFGFIAEGTFELAEFVGNASKGPNIRFHVIALTMKQLY